MRFIGSLMKLTWNLIAVTSLCALIGAVTGPRFGYNIPGMLTSAIDAISPTTSLLERGEQALEDGHRELRVRHEKLKRIVVDENVTESNLQHLRDELGRRERILVQLRDHLQVSKPSTLVSADTSITVGGKTYSSSELIKDLTYEEQVAQKLRDEITAVAAALKSIQFEKERLVTFIEQRTTRIDELHRALKVRKAQLAAVAAHELADAGIIEPEAAFTNAAEAATAINTRLDDIRKRLVTSPQPQAGESINVPEVKVEPRQFEDLVQGLISENDSSLQRAALGLNTTPAPSPEPTQRF